MQIQTTIEYLYVNTALYLTHDFQCLEVSERGARMLKMSQVLRSRQLLKSENVGQACIRLAREGEDFRTLMMLSLWNSPKLNTLLP